MIVHLLWFPLTSSKTILLILEPIPNFKIVLISNFLLGKFSLNFEVKGRYLQKNIKIFFRIWKNRNFDECLIFDILGLFYYLYFGKQCLPYSVLYIFNSIFIYSYGRQIRIYLQSPRSLVNIENSWLTHGHK